MRLRGAGAALLLAAALLPSAGRAAEVGAPVSFKADTLTHDREKGLVTARGNVEIRRGGRVLRADEVVYDRPADRLRAQGGVSLRDASGDVIFADRADVTGDLKDGVAERIRIRLADESRFSAESARRSDGVRTELRRAVYTPCRPCPEDPERTPSWRVRAGKVVRDRTTGEVVYRDATLELWGFPVFHTPYLEQSDPGVGRKTGLLTPTFGHKDDFGLMARLPVFFDIAPDRDATVTPVLTSGEGIFGLFEYRHRFAGGMFSGQGSLARGEAQIGGADARGHFDGRLRLDVDDFWRAGADVSLVSDDTYLGRYDLSSAKTLTSNLFVERFGERGYFAANAYRFQGLRREDRQKTIPLVLPEIEYAYLGAPDRLGGRADIDANFRMLVRETGGNSALLSLDGGWTLPHTAADGQILTAFARLRTDLYWAGGGGRTEAGTAAPPRLDGRVFPQLGLDWRYPFVRFDGGYEATITPVAGVVAGPRLGDVVSIADEDGPLPRTHRYERLRPVPRVRARPDRGRAAAVLRGGSAAAHRRRRGRRGLLRPELPHRRERRGVAGGVGVEGRPLRPRRPHRFRPWRPRGGFLPGPAGQGRPFRRAQRAAVRLRPRPPAARRRLPPARRPAGGRAAGRPGGADAPPHRRAGRGGPARRVDAP